MDLTSKLQFVRHLSWDDVFEIWRGNEENEEHWKEYYKAKNFNSWLEWRQKYIQPIKETHKQWELYRIVNPPSVVPSFHGGMYKGWLAFYSGKRFPTFHDIIRHPDIGKHSGIKKYLDNLAPKTTVIAWLTKRGVVIIEGMHRCAAVALAEKLGRKIEIDMYVAMAQIDEKDIPDFAQTVSFDDFKKLNIVVGMIESVEEIEGSEKLYKFTVNIGSETRQILGGLKLSYSPAELIGKQVLVLANLEPRMLMGLESQGMILAASDDSGRPVVVSPVTPVPNGSTIQ